MNLKKELTTQELSLLISELDQTKKSTVVTWLLWFFLGGLGGHRYYIGKIGTGILMTVTLGGLGIWTLIDAIFIQSMLKKKNTAIELGIIQHINGTRKQLDAASIS